MRPHFFFLPILISLAVYTQASLPFVSKPPTDAVKVTLGKERHEVSPMLNGFNTSYFNDLDVIWQTGLIEERLREIRTGALRYPGGEETSRFHWEHPGVDGYVDFWNPSHHDQSWQTTAVGKEQWESNELFVDLEEFIARCARVGAEPIIGINMSSGEVMNRRNEGIAEAMRLVRHIMERKYPVRYLYFDNEPWHKASSNYHFFPDNTYGEVYLEYARAIREVAPHLKFIASPVNDLELTGRMQAFLKLAGEYTDYLDFHFYWEWGRASTERWKAALPMLQSAKWTKPEKTRTFVENLESLKTSLTASGYDQIGVVILEWNIPPLEQSEQAMPPFITAMAQAEMLLQFARADVRLACLWPMFWQVQAPGSAPKPLKGNRHPWLGPFESTPPYAPTSSYAMFKLLKDLPGSRWIEASSTDTGVLVSAARDTAGGLHLWVLNKCDAPKTIMLAGREILEVAGCFDENGSLNGASLGGSSFATLPAWSLTHLRIK